MFYFVFLGCAARCAQASFNSTAMDFWGGPSAPAQQPAAPLPPSRPVCRHFLSPSGCTRPDCAFLHVAASSADAPVCVFYLKGACRNGAACPFRHSAAAPPPPPEPKAPVSLAAFLPQQLQRGGASSPAHAGRSHGAYSRGCCAAGAHAAAAVSEARQPERRAPRARARPGWARNDGICFYIKTSTAFGGLDFLGASAQGWLPRQCPVVPGRLKQGPAAKAVQQAVHCQCNRQCSRQCSSEHCSSK